MALMKCPLSFSSLYGAFYCPVVKIGSSSSQMNMMHGTYKIFRWDADNHEFGELTGLLSTFRSRRKKFPAGISTRPPAVMEQGRLHYIAIGLTLRASSNLKMDRYCRWPMRQYQNRSLTCRPTPILFVAYCII